MAFTAKDVQALRERTGVGMMECKKALTDADGNMDKAIELLREKGLAAAAKKAGRVASEGVVHAHSDNDSGVVVEVNSETDFVGKNEDFVAFVKNIAHTIASKKPKDVEELLTHKLHEAEQTVEEVLRDKILVIGENLKIRRFERYEGTTATYVHGGGKIGVMVHFDVTGDIAKNDAFKAAAKDVAMQVAAASPLYVRRDEVPAEIIEKEKEILTAQAINEGKPKEIAEKMVAGRINKYYKEFCLLEQPFVKNQDVSVQQYLEGVANELGGKIEVVRFTRFEKGEGLEKREDNFADEVAGMMNN